MAANRPDHSEGQNSYYRAYEIGADGRVSDSTDIFAKSDNDAVAQCRALANGRTIELWDRSRLVLRIEPT